jgi:hypothetical protein
MKAARKPSRPWVLLQSGRRVDLLEPSALDWDDEDLAVCLSRTNRWGGHSRWHLPLSVARHSLTSWRCASEASRELLHDADEGFLGFDPISPLKQHLGPHYENVVETCSARSRCATACRPGNPMSMPRTSTPAGSRQRAKRSSSRTMSATPKHEGPREAERNSTKRAKPVPLAHPAPQGFVTLPRSRAGARPCPAVREGPAVHGVEKKTTGGSDP